MEHDESISLLAAAGKSQKISELEDASKAIAICRASEIQDWLRPTGTKVSDVRYSLAAHDRHPPLYFLILHALQRVGVESRTWLRLIGTLALFLGAWFGSRYIWPDASTTLRCIALVWILAAPVSLETATEIRQYGIIFLGVLISVAAVLCHLEGSTNSRENIFLLVAAPAVLLWSQIASIVWVAVCVMLAIVPCLLRVSGAIRRIVWALTFSLVVLLPLCIRWLAYPSGLMTGPVIAWTAIPSQLLEPMCRSIARAWFSHPGRIQFTLIPAAIGAGALVVVSSLGFLSRSRSLRWLTLGMLGWLTVWCVLLAMGRIPPQALMSKQLLPVIVCMFAIVIREAQAGWKDRAGRIAIVLLLISVVSHPLGIIRLIDGKASQAALISELHKSDALLATAPQRGHLLPLIDVLRPDAMVIVGGSARVLQDWNKVAPVLPLGDLVLAHIRSGESGKAIGELRTRLNSEYSEAEKLRDEKSRTLTAYRSLRLATTEP